MLATLAAVAMWHKMRQPMFVPGTVRSATGLDPTHTDPHGPWQVAPHIALAHHSVGAGQSILVVHGGPGIPPTEPAPALTALSDRFSVHHYDQRGCGASTRPYTGATASNTWANIQELEGVLGMGAQIGDIERIRRILGEDRIVLVGHSYGALLAALYAAEFPDRVVSLVLIAPADLLVFPSPHGGLFDNLRTRLPANAHARYDAWLAEYLDLSNVFNKSTAELEALDAQLIAFFQAAMGASPAAVALPISHTGVWHARAQFFSGGMVHDWRAALASVTAPTLVVHGEDDLQPIDVAHQYAAAIPSARTLNIPGAGHSPQFTHSAALAPALRAFLLEQ